MVYDFFHKIGSYVNAKKCQDKNYTNQLLKNSEGKYVWGLEIIFGQQNQLIWDIYLESIMVFNIYYLLYISLPNMLELNI